jgi:hypothetical protein
MIDAMRDVFVLGAGFSMAMNPFMPSTNELGRRVLEVQELIHDSRVDSRHSNICDGLSCDWPVIESTVLVGQNFEEWLSTLAESQPYLLSPENDRRHALFTELTGVIATQIDSAVGVVTSTWDAPEWLLRLVRLWHHAEADVVTFNYDTLVESAVERAAIPHPDDPKRQLAHVNVGPSVLPWWDAGGYTGLRHRAAKTFRYFKLHGSTDWFWDEVTRTADSMVEIGLRHMWGEDVPRYDDEERTHRAPGKVPMIVPPTTTKTGYFDNPVIRHLWHGAYRALQAADNVFVIGYSVPPADTLVRWMLASSLSDAAVWVVNPAGEVGNRVAELCVRPPALEFCGKGDVDMSAVVDRYESLLGLR